MRTVRIKSTPKKHNPDIVKHASDASTGSAPDIKARSAAPKYDRDEANMEVEGGGYPAKRGESIFGIDEYGQPFHYFFDGPKHSQGGIPYKGKGGEYVFSDHRPLSMTGEGNKQFNKPADKKLTPAEIARQYDINKNYEVLMNPDASPIDKKTAQFNIDRATEKLSLLALRAEIDKGLPKGVPQMGQLAVQKYPELVENLPAMMGEGSDMMMQDGGEMTFIKNGETYYKDPTGDPNWVYQRTIDGGWLAKNAKTGKFFSISDDDRYAKSVSLLNSAYSNMSPSQRYFSPKYEDDSVTYGKGMRQGITSNGFVKSKSKTVPSGETVKNATQNIYRPVQRQKVDLSNVGTVFVEGTENINRPVRRNSTVSNKPVKIDYDTTNLGTGLIDSTKNISKPIHVTPDSSKTDSTSVKATYPYSNLAQDYLNQFPVNMRGQMLEYYKKHKLKAPAAFADPSTGDFIYYNPEDGIKKTKAYYGAKETPTPAGVFNVKPFDEEMKAGYPNGFARFLEEGNWDDPQFPKAYYGIHDIYGDERERQRRINDMNNGVYCGSHGCININKDADPELYEEIGKGGYELYIPPIKGYNTYQNGGGVSRNVRIKSLPQYQTKGEVATYTPTRKVRGTSSPTHQAELEYLETVMHSPETEQQRKLMYDRFVNDIKNNPRLDDNTKSKIIKKYDSPEKVRDVFMHMQEANYTFDANKILNPKDQAQKKLWDTRDSKEYKNQATKFGLTPLDDEGTIVAQTSFNAFADVAEEDPNGPFANFNFKGYGMADEFGTPRTQSRSGSRTHDISQADRYYGNTTAGEMARVKDFAKIPKPKVDNKGNVVFTDDKTAVDDFTPGRIKAPRLNVPPPMDPEREWRNEDSLNFYNNVGNYLKRKTDYPTYGAIKPKFVESVFVDPHSQIFNAQSQYAKQADAMSAFGAPQTMAAGLGLMGAQNAANVAQTIGNYDNQNKATANQDEYTNTNIYNQYAGVNAQLKGQFLDRVAASDASARAEEEARRNIMLGSFNTGESNASRIYNMNLMNKNFQIDPSSEMAYFRPGYNPWDPSDYQDEDEAKLQKFNNAIKRYPHVNPETLYKVMFGKNQGMSYGTQLPDIQDPGYGTTM